MIHFEIVTEIKASPGVCFDLSRDLDFHQSSLGHTQESIVGGRLSGLIELGEKVTWRAKHFGLFHLHTSRITSFEKPSHFRDEMTHGRFQRFVHDHFFETIEGGTRMKDVIEFEIPYGWFGRLVEACIMRRHIRRLITTRNEALQRKAESTEPHSQK